MPARLEVHVSKWRTLWLLVLTCVMVAVGYFCATLAQDYVMRVVGWIGVCFFSLGFIVFPWMLFKTGPIVIVDERGLEYTRSKFGVIEWNDVVTLSIGEIYSQRFLCIEVVDAEKYLNRLPAAVKVVARSNRALGFTEITIGFGGLSHTAQEVMNFIREHYAPVSN